MKLVRFTSGVNEYIFVQIPFGAREFDIDYSEKINATTVSCFNPLFTMETLSGKYMLYADNTYITKENVDELIPNKKGWYKNFAGDKNEKVENYRVAMQLLLSYLELKNKIWILKRVF